MSYADRFDDYAGFLAPRLEEARRLLTDSGSLHVHLDWRESHYCKVLLDEIFGRECFLNEVIWAYDYGGRAKDRWPAKHDTILVYVKHVGRAPVRPGPDRAGAVPRARAGRAREGRPGQAADRRVVAHDRADGRRGEDRLPHPEAGGRAAAAALAVLPPR